MKKNMLSLGIILLTMTACHSSGISDGLDADKELDYCVSQSQRTLAQLKDSAGNIDYTMVPRNIPAGRAEWDCRKTTKEEWCQGFWPGVLWYDYEYSHDEQFLEAATRFTEPLLFLSETPAYDHDLGFLVFLSYGNAYRLTHRDAYRKVILATADTLATLFNPRVGTLLSWPREVSHFGGHCTIMDNMINLEMLFWASKNGGDSRLYDIAKRHAEMTMQHAFRKDYTSCHVCVYDSLSGRFLKGVTHQGYADSSMWARGQAWAVYGFTMAYRETKDPKFLDFVQKVADVYLQRLPADGVPYWDFSAPDIPRAYRDASSAAIVASALLELSTYVKGDQQRRYRDAAVKMLKTLSSKAYRGGPQKASFLLHSVGNLPAVSEIDVPIIYADYYYIEALIRLKRLSEGRDVLG